MTWRLLPRNTHRVLLKLPMEQGIQAAEFGADANSKVLRAGDAPSLQEAAAQTLILSWLLAKLNTEPQKRIKFPLLTETWEQPQKPNLALASTSQTQRGFRLCLGGFSARNRFVLMHFHDNLKGETQ